MRAGYLLSDGEEAKTRGNHEGKETSQSDLDFMKGFNNDKGESE